MRRRTFVAGGLALAARPPLPARAQGAGPEKSPSPETRMPEIIAHRGASFDAPENTLAAFKLAWEQAADGIEGDFRLTQDGRILCSHDARTKRTGDRDLAIADSTFDALRQVDVGGWKGERWKGERMPSVEEALAVVPAGKTIFIEIYAPGCVPQLKEAIARSSLDPKQVVVISFERKAVAAARAQIAGIRGLWIVSVKKDKATGAATPSPEEILAVLKEARADGVDCSACEAIDAGFVRRVRDAGFSFHVWTVDDAETARRFRSYGVQSITTNRPGWIRGQLEDGTSAR